MQLPAKAATAAAHIFIFATPRPFGSEHDSEKRNPVFRKEQTPWKSFRPAQNKNPGPRPGVFVLKLVARWIRHHGLNLKLMPARTMFSVNLTEVLPKQLVVQVELP